MAGAGLPVQPRPAARAVECKGGHRVEGFDDEELFGLLVGHLEQRHADGEHRDVDVRERIAAGAYDVLTPR